MIYSKVYYFLVILLAQIMFGDAFGNTFSEMYDQGTMQF